MRGQWVWTDDLDSMMNWIQCDMVNSICIDLESGGVLDRQPLLGKAWVKGTFHRSFVSTNLFEIKSLCTLKWTLDDDYPRTLPIAARTRYQRSRDMVSLGTLLIGRGTNSFSKNRLDGRQLKTWLWCSIFHHHQATAAWWHSSVANIGGERFSRLI